MTPEERKAYNKLYYAKHRTSNTIVRDSKNRERLAKLAAGLHYTANRDGGKVDDLDVTMLKSEYGDKYIDLHNNGWSDLLIINMEALANCIESTRQTVSNYLKKLESMKLINIVGKYRLSNSEYYSTVIIVNLAGMNKEFDNEFFDYYEDIGSKYYINLHINEEEFTNVETSTTIKLNNNCMKYEFWHHVKDRVEEWNNGLPNQEFITKSLNKGEDGNYHDGRCFNILCNTKNPERHPDDTGRVDKLKELYGEAEYEEFDMNANILRINYDLTHEELFPKNKDIYYELYLLTKPKKVLSEVEFKQKLRPIFKKEFMPIYMKPQSVYLKQRRINELKYLNLTKYNTITSVIEEAYNIEYSEFIGRLKEAIYKFLSIDDFDKIYRVQFSSMYFKFEIAVMTEMNLLFRNLNIESINVYDGFYFKKGIMNEDTFYKVYNEAINIVKNNIEIYKFSLKNFTKEIKYFKYI